MSVSPSQKLAIATYFILSSPCGEVDEVLADVRNLVQDPSVLTDEAVTSILRTYNADQLTVAPTSTGQSMLVAPAGHIKDDVYYEPNTEALAKFDHVRRVWAAESESVTVPSYPAEQKVLRGALQSGLVGYLAGSFKPNKSLAAVYCNAFGGFDVLITAKNVNLGNFWTGSWRSTYTLTPNGQTAELTGAVKAHVHYFEDGNVQLNSSTELKAPITFDINDAQATAKRIVDTIAKFEGDYQNELEEMYVNMHRTTFKAMRRILPINKQKFLWSIAAHSLAAEVNK